MRYLILSDIHANRTALQAVLDEARGLYDAIVSCGDVVGYGPEPNEVVEFCREHCAAIVRGNHDKACAGLADLDWFNPLARISAIWTATTLNPENLRWVADLPEGPLDWNGFVLLHGSPRDEDEYIVTAADARDTAPFVTAGLTFFGHTHLQGGFELHRNGVRVFHDGELRVEETSAYLINPGSVGQPRDGDARAAWALFDTDTRVIEWKRTHYPIEDVHRRILELGLPEVLALRLYRGG